MRIDPDTSSEYLVCDERRPGIEVFELHGAEGYEGERLILENGLSNGLRFLITDAMDDGDGGCFAHFHIQSSKAAKLLAQRLIEFSDRIANPPDGN